MKKRIYPRLLSMGMYAKAVILFLCLSTTVKAQTFYTETFDGTPCAAGSGCDPSLVSWTVTSLATAPGNGGDANRFYVSCQEQGNAAGACGSACASGAGDQSLHVANVSTSSAAPFFCPGGDCGAAYDDSGPGEATNKRAESPTISCVGQSNITIAFNYIEQGTAPDDVQDDASLWYFDGATWAVLNALASTSVAGCGGQGRWTAFSATLPASANGNPLVKIGFVWTNDGDGNATDPSFAVDDITLTSSSTNTITTGTITGSPFCACSTVNVPFTSTGTFTAGNIYTAQLSNAAGSFAAPTSIGTLASTANTGTIACTIPCATPTGGAYRIRVVSSAPVVTGTDNGVNITINAIVVPSVSIVAAPAGAICAGTSVTFTATPTNGGASPSYQWQINGTNSGGPTSSATFTSTTLVNGDQVTVILTSNATCPSPATATSNTITMTVNPTVVPSVSITSTPSPATICAGDLVSFTSAPTNGGAAPTYQWQINGTNSAGATSSTFSSTTLANGDQVTLIMTSNAACASPTTATSNTVTITVTPAQDSTFSYSGSTFCQSGTDPVPTVTTAGGTFSATPAGLVFISTSTGEIDLSASTLGTYSVTYTTPGPCATSMTVSVTITTAPAADFSYTPMSYCQNDADPSPTFSGSGSAGTFTSSAGLVFVSAATGQVDLSASTPGIYLVTNTIAASGGCPAASDTASIIINAMQDSTFSYSGSPFCQSGTDPTPTITGTSGGTFSATPAGLVFISTSTGEIDLSASTLGTYSVTYTTPGPCASSMTVSVTITTAPAADFAYTPMTYCQNDPDASPTFSGGGVAGTFTSTAGLVFVSATTGQVDLSASTAGIYVVTNTIAASGGCPASSDTASIIINAAQDSTFTYGASTFCQSGGTNPTPTITGATGGTFSASPAGLVFVSTSTGEIDLAGSSVGTYAITYTTPGPCASSMTVTVNIVTTPVADFSYTGTPYCQNDPNPSPTYSGGGTAGTFTASPAGLVFVSTTTGQVDLAGSTPGTYTVTNTISTSGCPTTTFNSSITINAVPNVTVTSATMCAGDPPVNLTASGASTYSWSSGVSPTTGANVTAAPASTTSYTVTGTTSGCSNTAVATVVVQNCNVPVANFSGTPTVMCDPGCANFTDLSTNSPTSWQWNFLGASPSSSTAQNPTNICYSANGSYDVQLIATNSSGSDTLLMVGYITVGSPVQVTISGTLLVTSCEEATLTADPSDGTYSWGPNISGSGPTVTFNPPSTQEVWVEYTSPQGCTDGDTVTVVVEDINTYFLPTGFTPNGDGINDEIHLHGRGIDYFTLKIFDRIGEKVFETSDLEKGWNGRYIGLPMNDGVFVYILDITFCNGETVKQHGDITLVK